MENIGFEIDIIVKENAFLWTGSSSKWSEIWSAGKH